MIGHQSITHVGERMFNFASKIKPYHSTEIYFTIFTVSGNRPIFIVGDGVSCCERKCLNAERFVNNHTKKNNQELSINLQNPAFHLT